MAISMQRETKQENPNSCRALITTKDPNIPPNSPLSYFLNITIPQPRIRIKVPKLVAKTMQKRSPRRNDTDADRGKKKWVEPKKLLPKKIGSIFSNVFGNNKSAEMSSSNGEKDRVNEEKEKGSLKNVEQDYLGSVRSTRTSSDKRLNCVDQPFSSSKSRSLKDILELEDEEVKQKRVDERKKSRRADETPLKVPLSFSSFFNKKTSLNFLKSKINKTRCNNSISSSSSRGDYSSANGVGNNYSMNGRLESSNNLAKVPSTIPATREKMRRAKSMPEKVTKREEEEDGGKEERREKELCKKRILMGEKCRPLNISGSIHYDKNGIFLAEEVIP